MALTSQQNGASPQQAFALSTIAGTASYITNKIPVSNLFKLMGNGAKSFVNGLARYAGQISENVVQGVLESCANTIADTAIMGDESHTGDEYSDRYRAGQGNRLDRQGYRCCSADSVRLR